MGESHDIPNPELYWKILELRSVKEMKQGAIARELKIDPREVTPLLFRATKWLMGEQKRLSNSLQRSGKSELEEAVLRTYTHLEDVFIVEGGSITTAHEYDALLSRWSSMAAAYFDGLASDEAAAGKELHVCMSGGETILELVNNLPPRDRENVYWYASALIGRSHLLATSHVDAIANVTVAWYRSGRFAGRCIYATVSPYDLSAAGKTYEERRQAVSEEIDSLSEIPPVKQYLKHDLLDMDVAIVGLGTVIRPNDPTFRGVRFSATDLLKHTAHIDQVDLQNDKAIGEIGYCYFDRNGIGHDKWRFYLTAGDRDPTLRGVRFYSDMVENKKKVIVIAGAFKEPAINAALRGKLFNVWFTNEEAARAALEAAPASSTDIR
jgi:DNA-binding transcriptional regulator LsrR (DeoR family)